MILPRITGAGKYSVYFPSLKVYLEMFLKMYWELVIGTVLAVFVNQKIKGVQVFRLIYFSPQVVTITNTEGTTISAYKNVFLKESTVTLLVKISI